LFRFSYQLKNAEPGKNHAVVHFWLCPKCARTYSLEYREKSGTAVLRLKNPPTRMLKSKTTHAKTQQPIRRRLREKVSAA
jgi:hypothetical protein